MRTFRMGVPVIVTVCMLLLAGMQDAYAQKKKTTTTKAPTTTQQTPPPASQSAPKMGNSLKDLLGKFKGELTTLGVLKQVEFDYFAVEEEGTLVMYPMSTIKSIKVIKPAEPPAEEEAEEEAEEPEPMPKLDIRLQ
ncbi:MAG: hypothetical protein H6Q31_1557 [Bacteroidetes bacterium]|nr:hypothetical protein [Bacteroidota bacterium]